MSRSKQLAPAVDIRPTDDDSSSSAADSSAAAVTASESTDSSPSAPVAPAAKRRRRNELEALQDSLTAAGSDSAGEEEEESKEDQTDSGKPLAPNNGAVACTIAYQLDEGGVPVFRPTWDEFHDFARFIEEANVSARRQTAVARATCACERH